MHFFISDLLAGLTVSFTSLSFGAAFGIQSGRGAFAGMIAAAVIPIISSLLGGTRVKASGPTAPVTAISAVIVAQAYDRFGQHTVQAEQFITLIFCLTAVFLIIAGLVKLGQYVSKVPHLVILGFMNGIALLIWIGQAKILFGIGQSALIGPVAVNLLIALGTVALILLLPKLIEKYHVPQDLRIFFPSVLVAILVMTIITAGANLDVQRVSLAYAPHSLGELIQRVPLYLPGPDLLQLPLLLMASSYALQLAMLTYFDCLLTSLIMDRLTGWKSRRNEELMSQGAANVISAFLGGIPGAQATVRSVMLYKEGARTRLGGVFDGIFTLAGIFLFAPVLGLVASAVFVGVLIKAGWDIFDKDFFQQYLAKHWWKAKTRTIQLGITVLTTGVTVLVDLNMAVLTGTGMFYALKKTGHVHDLRDERLSDGMKGED